MDNLQSFEMNEFYLKKLIDKIIKNDIIPFIGAGISIPFQYKGWKAFVNYINDSNVKLKTISKLIDKGNLEEAVDKLIEKLSIKKINDLIDYEYREEKINESEIDNSSIKKIVDIFPDSLIITTNYDNVIEKAFTISDNPIRNNNVYLGANLGNIEKYLKPTQNILIKIHGTIKEPANRILSKSQYNTHYKSKNPLPDLLTKLMTSRSFLFIGCSLENDRMLQLLEKVAKNNPQTTEHFTLLKIPRNAKSKVKREQNLSKKNIGIIWYKDHPDVKIILEYVKKIMTDNASIKKIENSSKEIANIDAIRDTTGKNRLSIADVYFDTYFRIDNKNTARKHSDDLLDLQGQTSIIVKFYNPLNESTHFKLISSSIESHKILKLIDIAGGRNEFPITKGLMNKRLIYEVPAKYNFDLNGTLSLKGEYFKLGRKIPFSVKDFPITLGEKLKN
ncbi:MAG: hypothetical protein HeimC3_23560 [Candidatus Heimdallarchaeota archaeon LC_3]|nr:MAG: hypothetical protein HeimC3_23560 [Candidatus Heimdallarchaeota archaeon LC_3]